MSNLRQARRLASFGLTVHASAEMMTDVFLSIPNTVQYIDWSPILIDIARDDASDSSDTSDAALTPDNRLVMTTF